ncbi:MAG: pilus assembly protein CpaC [Candidatus Eremiobacteraeota bacterium]|nr:pilus assembly protein CpaC [Candidatus Eremiobacteraeota bacterium]
MHDLLRTSVIAAAAAVIAVTPLGARADATVPVTLRTGQSVSVSTPRLTRVAVGDGKIAGVLAVGNSEIVINGRSAGRTTLLVWMNGSRRTFDVTVTEQSLTSLRAMLQGAISDRDVRVDAYDHSIVLNGTVATGESLVHLGEVVAHFEPVAAAGKYVVVNAVTVAKPLGPLQSELAGAAATSGVRVDRDAKGNLIVSGQVEDRTTAEHVLRRVRTLAGPYLAADGKVIDRIETATISQVDIKVYVLEVDETALRQLGVNLQSAAFHPDGTYTLGGPQFPVVESPFTGLNKGAGPFTDGRGLTLGAFFRSITLAPTLNLIMQNGHARVLSSPDLVTMPGREANFLVGGQIPIPVATGPQQIAIQYKDFGVKLVVTPTILGEGNVETIIAPEVSDLDFQDGVSINGFVVPALKTSRLSTDVVTKAGESIVMGGLLRRQEQRTIDKIPLLGDLPILGKLFRSSRYQSSQTDVVFVMTPQILTR